MFTVENLEVREKFQDKAKNHFEFNQKLITNLY